jgi:hypothetical protein
MNHSHDPHKSEAPAGQAGASAEQKTTASIIASFSFPSRHASACAEVLARLLRGQSLTSIDIVFEASTTRCAAHVHHLRNKHGWPIETEERLHACDDGRTTTISIYRLPAAAIELARAAGSEKWIADVEAARAAQRARAGEAVERAARMNAERLRTPDTVGSLL